MSPDLRAKRSARLRRIPARACPECGTSWAVRGSRHPSGAWLLLCAACDWRRVVPPAQRPALDDQLSES